MLSADGPEGGGNAASSAPSVAASRSSVAAARGRGRGPAPGRDTRRLRDRDHVALPQQPGKRNLRRRGAPPRRDRREIAVGQEPALAQRAVGHHRHPLPAHPRQQLPLDAALAQVIEHLVGRALAPARQRPELAHRVGVEVGHAPARDPAVAAKLLERGDGFRQRDAPAPMQQVEVQALDPQPLEAALAGRDGAPAPGIVGVDLADDEDLVAAPGDRLGHDFLGAAVAVNLRGVDERHPEVEAQRQRGGLARGRAPSVAHAPGAQTQRRHAGAVGQRHVGNGRQRSGRRLVGDRRQPYTILPVPAGARRAGRRPRGRPAHPDCVGVKLAAPSPRRRLRACHLATFAA
jgi:hypothetical protein